LLGGFHDDDPLVQQANDLLRASRVDRNATPHSGFQNEMFGALFILDAEDPQMSSLHTCENTRAAWQLFFTART
jgi:hypothetical protein